MTRTAIALILATTPAIADDAIPAWCCPQSCISLDGDMTISGTGVTTSVEGHAPQELPFAKGAYIGLASDNQTHVCIGFTDFGDREVKCLLTPPLT